MKAWHFAGVGLVLLTSLGCRTDPAIPILERELRLKEDEIYCLRSKVEDLQDSLAECRSRPAAGKPGAAEGVGRGEGGGEGPLGEAAGVAPPSVEFPKSGSTELPPIFKGQGGSKSGGGTPPSKQPSRPAYLPGLDDGGKVRQPRGDTGRSSLNDGSMDGPALEVPPRIRGAARGLRGRLVSRESGAPASSNPGNTRSVKSITLDSMLTGGLNDDFGHSRLLVVVEPRDAEKRVIQVPAKVSMVVLDPAVLDREGYATRVARWDFTTGEIAKMFRRTSSGAAIHIEAAWPDGTPAHGKLHLFVRYTTADGRKLEADQPIEVATSGEKSPRIRHATNNPSPGDGPAAASLSQQPRWSPERR